MGGATVGGLSAGLRDAGIQGDSLKALGATLNAGDSAVVLAVDPADAQAAEDELTAAGATTVREGLSGEAVAILKQQVEPTEDTQQNIARGMMDEGRMQ